MAANRHTLTYATGVLTLSSGATLPILPGSRIELSPSGQPLEIEPPRPATFSKPLNRSERRRWKKR